MRSRVDRAISTPARPLGRTRECVAVGYARRSTDRQEQSIPDQKRAIERYVEEHGITLLRIYVDDAISGTSTVGRRAFQSLIADAQRRDCPFGQVVVYDVKRFGRVDNDEAGYYRHLLRRNGVEIRYVSEGFNGGSTDDLLRPVKQWQARQESKDLSKVTIRGLLSRSTSQGGWWMGGVPPLGYDLRYENASGGFLFNLRHMPDGSKIIYDEQGRTVRTAGRGETIGVSRKDRCRLFLSEESRVKIVREIFRLYIEDRRGFKAIADRLNRQGVPTARGPAWNKRFSGRWAQTTIKAILSNPAYVGDAVWNRRTDARFHRITNGQAIERPGVVGRRLENNQEVDWIVVPDAHPPIVSRRIFELAQRRLNREPASQAQRGFNQRTGLPAGVPEPNGAWTGPRARYLLSGLVTCGVCGSRYEGHTQYGKPGPGGKRTKRFEYACGGYIRHGRTVCRLHGVPQESLERTVVEALVQYYSRYRGTEGQRHIEALFEEHVAADRGRSEAQLKKVRSRLTEIETITRNLLDNITEVNRDMVDRRLAELTLEQSSLQEELEFLEQLALTEEQLRDLVRQTARFAEGLEATMTGAPLEDRVATVRRCVEGIVLDQPKRQLTLRARMLPATGSESATDMLVPIVTHLG